MPKGSDLSFGCGVHHSLARAWKRGSFSRCCSSARGKSACSFSARGSRNLSCSGTCIPCLSDASRRDPPALPVVGNIRSVPNRARQPGKPPKDSISRRVEADPSKVLRVSDPSSSFVDRANLVYAGFGIQRSRVDFAALPRCRTLIFAGGKPVGCPRWSSYRKCANSISRVIQGMSGILPSNALLPRRCVVPR